MKLRTSWLVLLAGLAGCAPREPMVIVGSLAGGLDDALAARPLAEGQAIRADEVARTPAASCHLVQVRGAERPHVHATHDLVVVVLRGRGTLMLDGQRRALAPGDVVAVPRGAVHWFANGESGAAVALVVFTPGLDAPDVVPAVVDSPTTDR